MVDMIMYSNIHLELPSILMLLFSPYLFLILTDKQHGINNTITIILKFSTLISLKSDNIDIVIIEI